MHLLAEFFKGGKLLYELACRDFRQQNQGTYLGVVWNYLQPLLYISVLFFILSSGFRGSSSVGSPFAAYLITGMSCWLYFVNNVSSMSKVIKDYSFLVKKVEFRLIILPLIKLLSSFLPHFILILFAIAVCAYYHIQPSLFLFQLPYYFISMVVLLIGIGWLTSSTSVFVKDIGNIVGVITQFGFWLTPIFWHMDMMPDNVRAVLRWNPVYYLVSGYRDAILGGQWPWERVAETFFFWLFALLIFIFGNIAFRKLQPHFAEMM